MRFGGDGVGRLIQPARRALEPAGGFAQPRQRAFHRGAELPDHRADRLAAPLARRIGFGLHAGQPLALDHVVAEHHHGARHGADLVARVGRRNARRGVAAGEPLHHLGQSFERRRDRAADQPAGDSPSSAKAKPTQAMIHCVRARDAARAARGDVGVLLRGGDDLIGLGQHALGVVIDQRQQRLDVVGVGDPLGERIAVGLHLPC